MTFSYLLRFLKSVNNKDGVITQRGKNQEREKGGNLSLIYSSDAPNHNNFLS
jgi:hypothetical protein